ENQCCSQEHDPGLGPGPQTKPDRFQQRRLLATVYWHLHEPARPAESGAHRKAIEIENRGTVRSLLRLPATSPRHLHRLAACCRSLPDFKPPGPVGRKVDPA